MEVTKYTVFGIYSPAYAEAMMQRLSAHGIKVKSEICAIGKSKVAVGIRLSVPELSLSLAIKIAESGSNLLDDGANAVGGKSGTLLIPVDLSDYSMLAVRAGLEFAKRLDLHPLILHAYAVPLITTPVTLADTFTDDVIDQTSGIGMRLASEKKMAKFVEKIKAMQKDSTLTDVKFTTHLSEGLPEDVIAEYCRLSPPELIVMATRGRRRRQEELIGSVTAEVLDTCRVPVFTVPDNITFVGVENITRLIFFCNLDKQDRLSIDSLMLMFDCPKVDVTLIPVAERGGGEIETKTRQLSQLLAEKYPLATFTPVVLGKKEFRPQLEKLVEEKGIQLIIVPNKKTNIFSRLFNPGIAHRILFDRDMPMLALPV